MSELFYGYKVTGASGFYDIRNEIGTENGGRSVITNVGYSGSTTVHAINFSYQDSVQLFNTLIDTILNTSTTSPNNCGIQFANPCSNFNIYGDTIRQMTGGEPYGINIASGTSSGINYIKNCVFTEFTATGGNMNVLRNEGSALGTLYLTGNTLSNLNHSTADKIIEGFYLNSGSTFYVGNNKFYGFNHLGTGTSVVEPIFVNNASNNSTIYNNFVYNIKAPNSTDVAGTRAIRIENGTIKLYHNTFLINCHTLVS